MEEKILDVKINDVAFKVDASFSPEYWRDIINGQWEEHTFDMLDFFVAESDVILDIGCWAGPLSLYSAAKGANVVCIDPDPLAFQALSNNINLNPELKTRMHPFQIAIAPQSKRVPLYARKAYGHSSTSLLHRTRDQISNASAEGCSLEKFVKTAQLTQIDFIKIDMEGGEFAIVDDLINVIEKFDFPTIYLSLHFDQLNEALYQSKLGVRLMSLLLLKFEQYFPFRLFAKVLRRQADAIIHLVDRYDHIYNQFGYFIPRENLTAPYLLSNKVDLVLSNRRWHP